MKTSGIQRKLDELGRVVLPIEMRKTLNINEGDKLDISLQDEKIVLRKYEEGDIFTGQTDDLIEYRGKKISRASIMEMYKLISEN